MRMLDEKKYGRINSIHEEVYNLIREDDWRKIMEWLKTSPMMIEIIIQAPKELIKEPFLNMLIEYEYTDLVLNVIAELAEDGLKMKNFNGDTALHVAASKGNIVVANALLDISAALRADLLQVINKDGETALHRAALNGHSAMFWNLLQGSSPKIRRADGATVLHCAIMAYHFTLAVEMIEDKQTADLIFARDQLGFTPLHHMVSLPDAFPSGCDLGSIDLLIYKCLPAEKFLSSQQKKNRSNDKDSAPRRPMDDELFGTDEEYNPPDDEEENKTSRSLGQCLGALVNNIYESMTKWKKNRAAPSDPEEGEEDQLFASISYKRQRRLFVSDVKVHETQGESYKFFSFLVRSMQNEIYEFMNRKKYKQDLIHLKKKHVSAIHLLSSIAMNREYWWSLSLGGIPENPSVSRQRNQDNVMDRWMETPLTLAASLRLNDLVIRILKKHPAAATYPGKEGKNVLHVAVEKRDENIVNFLKQIGNEDPRLPSRLKSSKDDNGNTILHLAAICNNQLSSPLQMSEEFKWFEQVKELLPKDLVNYRNKDGKTAREVFTESHMKMVESAKTQLTNTASSCCSALVTAVTFAAGFSIAKDNDKKGTTANDRTTIVLNIFSHAYIFGLSCTAIALVQFMALLMASYKEEDFRRSLPTQYRLALATLFTAMMAMVVAFGCNTYISLSTNLTPNWKDYLLVGVEVLIVPLAILLLMRCGGVKFRMRKI